MYQINNKDSIIRLSDNACIPKDINNSDYKYYLEWIAEGNVPLPAKPDPIPVPKTISQTCEIKDVKPAGQAGGTSISNTICIRQLNTISGDAFATVSNNRIKMAPGKARIEIKAPANAPGITYVALHNLSTQKILKGDLQAFSGLGQVTAEFSVIIEAETEFEVQQYIQVGKETDGLGIEMAALSGQGNSNTYTTVKLTSLE